MSSSQREVVSTNKASKPNPTLSQATIRNGFVFCGGVLGTDPETGTIVEGTIGDRTIRCLKNLEAVLEAAGSSLDKVLKVLIFVTDIKDVPILNEAYNTMFKEPRPARACVAVKELARGTDVEMECVGFI